MYNKNKYSMPFCGLQLKLFETGKKAPSFEYQASSAKAKFQCSLTKKLYGLSEVMNWYKTPEVQAYAQQGYMLKWGSRIQDAKETKYGADTEQVVCIYMVKPYKSGAIDGMKPIGQAMPQHQAVAMTQAQPSAPDNAVPVTMKDHKQINEDSEPLDDEIPF